MSQNEASQAGSQHYEVLYYWYSAISRALFCTYLCISPSHSMQIVHLHEM